MELPGASAPEYLHITEVIDGQDLADDHVIDELDPHIFKQLEIFVNDLQRQAKPRDAVYHHTPAPVERLEYRHLITEGGQTSRGGEARGARPDDGQIDRAFEGVKAELGSLDFLVHAVAFAKREDLAGGFVETSRDGHALALDISAYSLTALAQRAAPLMTEGGSIVALTYLGAERVIPRYNVMGVAKAALEASVRYLAYDLGEKNIRVNGLSAGPVQTLAARGIAGFTEMMKGVESRSPMRRNVRIEEVADAAAFLLSPLSSGVTGETLYVDCGYNIVGM